MVMTMSFRLRLRPPGVITVLNVIVIEQLKPSDECLDQSEVENKSRSYVIQYKN